MFQDKVLLRFSSALTLSCAVLLIAGCASATDDAAPSDATNAAGETVSFEGPWAADFAEAYKQADGNEFVREVLADGIITDQEVSEASDRFLRCLEEVGFKNVQLFDDGTYGVSVQQNSTLDHDDLVHNSTDKCSTDSGYNAVVGLSKASQRNPDKLDENTIMAECLVRQGMAESGYSADDYARDEDDGKYRGGPGMTTSIDPEDVGSGSYTSVGSMGGDVSDWDDFEIDPRYEACSADPLGLGEQLVRRWMVRGSLAAIEEIAGAVTMRVCC